MRFFKDNSYDIIKLYVNQLGIMIFSMFLYTAIGAIEDEAVFNRMRVLVSVFAVLFYFVLIYNVTWEIGARDKIRIDGGRISPFRLKGIALGAVANVPNVILALIAIVLLLFAMNGGGQGVNNAFAILYMILRFHGAMYMGIIQALTPSSVPVGTVDYQDCLNESLLFLLLPLVSLLITQLGYYLGSNEKRIFGGFSRPNNK